MTTKYGTTNTKKCGAYTYSIVVSPTSNPYPIAGNWSSTGILQITSAGSMTFKPTTDCSVGNFQMILKMGLLDYPATPTTNITFNATVENPCNGLSPSPVAPEGLNYSIEVFTNSLQTFTPVSGLHYTCPAPVYSYIQVSNFNGISTGFDAGKT